MNDLLQEIKSSLLRLVGHTIEALPLVVVAIAILFITRHLANVTRRTTSATVRRMIRSSSLRSLFVQMSYMFTWVAGILVVCLLLFPSLRLGDLVALLGLSSVAISFAFQDVFRNLLAGIILLLNESFRLGDQVIVNGFEGTVEDITIRYTQIKTYQGERIVIPNAMVFTSPVRVLTAMPHRRTDLALGVDYNTDITSAIEVLLETLTKVEGVLSDPPSEIDAVGFGDSSIELMVRYWTLPQKVDVRQTQTRVMIALKEACEQANISMPLPIRKLYHYNQQQDGDHLEDFRGGDLTDFLEIGEEVD